MWYVDFASKSIKMVKKISRGCAPDPPLLHPSLDEHPRRPGPPAEAQSPRPALFVLLRKKSAWRAALHSTDGVHFRAFDMLHLRALFDVLARSLSTAT